jgi:organic hydroperoxide reductase OsmC/OhrA
MEKIMQYQVSTSWKYEKLGIIKSSVLDSIIEVATPPEFTGGIAGIWTPQHLLIGAISSCFMTTFLAIAEKMRLKFLHFSCDTVLLIENSEGKLSIPQITIHPIVTINNNKMSSKGLKVLDITAKTFIINTMLKTKINFIPQININES